MAAARTGLAENPGTLRLTAVRLAGQFGDGMFQAALSGAILFNPERETDPLAIAGGFAALLLPYSIIGPYAGALLDRWDRRLVLLVANVLRGVLIAITAVSLAAGASDRALLALALAVVGVSRFVNAGVSASLPRVLAQRRLVPMNSIMATAASGCAILGAGVAFSIIGLAGAGNTASGLAVAGSAVGSVVGAVAAAGFRSRALGPAWPASGSGGTPEETASAAPPVQRSAVRAIAAGLREGAVAVWRVPEVTTTMIGIGAHRIVFGADTLVMVLVLRRGDQAAVGAHIAQFSAAITATGAGMLGAAVVAPVLIPRLGRPRTVEAGLIMAIVVQLTLVTPITVAHGADEDRAGLMLLAAAFLLGLAGQTIKLTGDAAMQIGIDDAHRGQVFALQDTIFNITYVSALAGTALWIPSDGRSPAVVMAAAGVYACGIAAIALNSRRSGTTR
ncbi:MFS transporter [Nocardia sp. NPDC088792]|uniref:MFS transporter n=1 Tax=Nocardia sp. NPDC088792 TaxID=3364332 RepID=UPI00380E181D